jgi:hypothetical protein
MPITKEEAEEIDIVKYINNQKNKKKKEKICLQTQLKKQKEKLI